MSIDEMLDLVNRVARQCITIGGSIALLLMVIVGVIVTVIMGVWCVNMALRFFNF